MPDTASGLQVATRIHVLLLHEIGQGIDIEQMIRTPRYARDVLLVCDAFQGSELAQLALQFRQAKAAAAQPGPAGQEPSPSEWGPSTTGFSQLTRPADLVSRQAFAGRARQWISRWWHPG